MEAVRRQRMPARTRGSTLVNPRPMSSGLSANYLSTFPQTIYLRQHSRSDTFTRTPTLEGFRHATHLLILARANLTLSLSLILSLSLFLANFAVPMCHVGREIDIVAYVRCKLSL